MTAALLHRDELAPGEATAAPGRIDALHTLGTDVRTATTAHEALAMAGIAGLGVHKVPLQNAHGEVVPGKFGLEDFRGKLLPGITVGAGFRVVQFEENADLLDAVAARTGAVLDTSGAIDTHAYGLQGRCAARAFISLALPEPIMIGGDDPINAYIVALFSHGGASNFLLPSAIRPYCANQQDQLTIGNINKIVIRHTTSAPERMKLAEETLVKSVKAMRDMAVDAERMRAQQVTDDEFAKIVAEIYKVGGESKAAETRHERRIAAVRSIYDGPTNTNIRGSAWGVWQTVSEYDQWVRNVRGGEDGDDIARVRARRSVAAGGTANTESLRAFQIIRNMSGMVAAN
jgi:phage/plasmid-like protein (TIGR03299 family)